MMQLKQYLISCRHVVEFCSKVMQIQLTNFSHAFGDSRQRHQLWNDWMWYKSAF